jgi:putative hydrolase of the HAD superfamily
MGTNAQAGLVSDEELWRWVGKRLELDNDQLDIFRDAFWAGDELDLPLVDYIRSLRPRYQTAIISNATDNLRPALTEKFRIADAFDLIVSSAEERVMKPDPEIYLRTLQRLQRQPEECVFIDDSAMNVAAAAALGIQTLFYSAGIDVPTLLAEMGVHPHAEQESVVGSG